MTAYTSSQSGLASASSTWGGAGHPSANGDTFTIAVGHVVTWDLDLTGLTTGLGACTINGTFQVSTTAGSYGAKCNGTWTWGAAASFIVNNGTGVAYPSTCTFQQNFAGNFNNTLNATATVNIICGEPTHTIAKLTQQDNSGQAVLHVDTDLTGAGDSGVWKNGSLVRVDNVNKGLQSEQYTISSLTSTTVTLTGNLSNNKLTGSVVTVVSRNIKITGTGSTGIGFSGGTGAVIGAEVRGFASCFNGCTSGTIGGSISGSTNALVGCITCTVNAPIVGCTTGVNNCLGCTLSGPVISGNATGIGNVCYGLTCSSLISGCTTGVINVNGSAFTGSINGCGAGIQSVIGCKFVGITIGNCTNAAIGCNATFLNVTFSGNTNDFNLAASGSVAYGSTPGIFTSYNSPSFHTVWDYMESIDHGNVVGGFQAWCLGGIVSDIASPVYDATRSRSYKHAAESASAYVFRQQQILVPPKGSINVRCYVQADTAMAYLPRLWVFAASKEPLITGSADVEVTMPGGYSINTWYILSATFTNSSDEPYPYIVRTLAKNASGNVYFDPIIRVSGMIQGGNMEEIIIKRGRASQSVPIQILDTTSVVGAGKTGLVYNSANLTAYYKRELSASAVAISLATMTAGTWASGGFVEQDATHLAGWYELGLPNAVIDNSDLSTWVDVMVYDSGSGLGIAPKRLRIDLVAYNPQSLQADLNRVR